MALELKVTPDGVPILGADGASLVVTDATKMCCCACGCTWPVVGMVPNNFNSPTYLNPYGTQRPDPAEVGADYSGQAGWIHSWVSSSTAPQFSATFWFWCTSSGSDDFLFHLYWMQSEWTYPTPEPGWVYTDGHWEVKHKGYCNKLCSSADISKSKSGVIGAGSITVAWTANTNVAGGCSPDFTFFNTQITMSKSR